MVQNHGYEEMEERIEILEYEKEELRDTLQDIQERIDEVL